MKTVKIEHGFPQPADEVWAIFADVTRCDWVPAVEEIKLEGDVRSFEMEGIGEVQERIVLLDHEARKLQYSAINYKDALAVTGRGPIVRAFPCIAGVDGVRGRSTGSMSTAAPPKLEEPRREC